MTGARLPREAVGPHAGLSLLEVMVAVALLVIVLMGLGSLNLVAQRHVSDTNDRAIAHAAAQQRLEFLNAMSVADVLAFDEVPFAVEVRMSTVTNQLSGLVTVMDLGWDGSTGQAFLVTARIADPRTGREYAAVSAVRTR